VAGEGERAKTRRRRAGRRRRLFLKTFVRIFARGRRKPRAIASPRTAKRRVSRTSLHLGENPFACMCATTLRTPSVVPRSQHVLRSYCWQNVKPRFFEGGLPCARKSGYPACDTHVGALDLAATPARDTAISAATSNRARVVPQSVMLPRAVSSPALAAPDAGRTHDENARNATRGAVPKQPSVPHTHRSRFGISRFQEPGLANENPLLIRTSRLATTHAPIGTRGGHTRHVTRDWISRVPRA